MGFKKYISENNLCGNQSSGREINKTNIVQIKSTRWRL